MKRIRFTSLLALLLSALLPSAGEAQDTAIQIPLWSNGAPGFESRRNEPEEAKDYWVKNIHNPSITVYLPPKDKATGAAVVIFPGGGHRLLVFNAEGRDPARFLNSIGVAAFIVKWMFKRLAIQISPRLVLCSTSQLLSIRSAATSFTWSVHVYATFDQQIILSQFLGYGL